MLIKYPKTMHLPWSPGLQNDDRVIENLDAFQGRRVIVTEKMDGENASLYRDAYHARSLDGRHHVSRDWVKGFHGAVQFMIPEGMRLCGENLYAEHSVRYENLPSYFMAFGLWEGNICHSWDKMVELCKHVGIRTVPIIYDGLWNEELIKEYANMLNPEKQEGLVVRVADAFTMSQFKTHVAKWVRKNHVQTDEHWMSKPVVPNGLKQGI